MHVTAGNVPSSEAHGSTPKHLQLLRRDFLPFPPFLRSCLINPPKRGAPGVPGVAGVEGADTPSSGSIVSIDLSTLVPMRLISKKSLLLEDYQVKTEK